MATDEATEARAAEVLRPTSEEEAVAAFGDGADVLVVGGGTIVVPDLTARRLRPRRVLLLREAGLAGVRRDGSRVTIGAATSLQELVDLPAPLGPCAANIADLEIRSAATVGGNLCAGEGLEAPRGDLQGAFLALGAVVRSAGEGGIVEEPLEDFLPRRRRRLALDVSFEEPAAGAFAALDRPHTHDYTALAVSGARAADGTIRLAATGAGSYGVRLRSAEAIAGDPEAAGEAALRDVDPHDDALASAWYRRRVLPVLVRKVLAQLKEAA
ncbi:MAG TPA: FAD binding domain-containing protein [Gaiellaceae bacterium]|nr:FAD binding domain-containing protein [Gaiellaceae bacterium]